VIGIQDRWQEELFIAGSLSSIIPDDYILKRVDTILDLSWFRDQVRDAYDEMQGRPSIDPEAAIRLMLAGFFLGIIHDRKLMREAQVNLAIRWFAGYRLQEQLPHHSSLTRIRQRWGVEKFKRIFQRTVHACMEAGLVTAETVHIDATLIRADVSWDSLTERYVDRVMYENKVPNYEDSFSTTEQKQKLKKMKVSITDPDATYATNSRKHHLEPSYKQHLAVDDYAGVIVDVSTTTGSYNEGDEILEQIDRVEQLSGMKITAVTADGGYAYGKVYAGLEERGIQAVVPAKKEWCNKNVIPLRRFKYDAKHGIVHCPRGKILRKSWKNKHGWYYRSQCSDCNKCSIRDRCLSPNASNRRSVVISDSYEALLRARRLKDKWPVGMKKLYSRHRWRVEGVNSEAKCLHGLRRAVRRGIGNVEIQTLLTAAAINLKRLAA
jgi:transposase